MGYIASADAVTYEQDWLSVIYQYSPELGTTLRAGDAFTDGMARAAHDRGMSLQYCMALPRHFLQGARYGNLTTIRTSDDRFTRSKWDTFLYTSRLASALGIWPWTDVFMSTETDNVLIATLSGGMVGNGDTIGAENKENLLRAVRLDGVIIKPDCHCFQSTPCMSSDAAGILARRVSRTPCAHDGFGPYRPRRLAHRVRICLQPCGRKCAGGLLLRRKWESGEDVYLYDTQARTARRLAASEKFMFDLAPNGTAYYVLASVSVREWPCSATTASSCLMAGSVLPPSSSKGTVLPSP